jgi:predicted nucleotidyltransferase
MGKKIPKMGIKSKSRKSQIPRQASPGMADALFSTTQQRVLGLLFGQPERSFYTQQLIELAGAGGGSTQRELARLQACGLVLQSMVGTQKHYRANPASPIFAELCAIARKTLGPSTALREALAPAASEVVFALLYGSVAKGTDHADSDLDVMVLSDTMTLEDATALFEHAEQRLGRTVHPTVYTLAEFRRRRARPGSFVDKVLAGENVVLLGSLDDAR